MEMNTHGFCHLSIVPVRAAASDRSEMVNQLLFGDTFEIVEHVSGWKLIRSSHDKYEGFIDDKQYLALSREEFLDYQERECSFSVAMMSALSETPGGQVVYLSPGTCMHGAADGVFQIAGKRFVSSAPLRKLSIPPVRDELVAFARLFLHAPYLWGGRSIFGIDCSGLTQVVFRAFGMNIQRDASYQSQQGETLNLVTEALPGDLAFFDNDEGEIIHTGIISGEGSILHASGQVREDGFDHQGIYNHQLKKYTHRLRLMKRIIQ